VDDLPPPVYFINGQLSDAGDALNHAEPRRA
jgi:hypothetical protein